MNKKGRRAREKLDRLTDSLVEDILSMSDAEILAEATEEHDDVDTAVARVRGIISGAIAKSGKAKMQAARKALEETRDRGSRGSVFQLPFAEKRVLLERLGARDSTIGEQLTMAARKGGEMTEKDVDAILDALLELGAIDDDGRPT